ncbi:ATP synthase F0F1 subunit delta [Candidatus Francisella endociliophora]|uniref:ATP synthase subunit delta n=1 Tax=Candidatus Francisella endociliophora TaxID=653937 RepID=A0A097EPI6_9GAMM|nr:F0F1 ATP synthase subunit delta [Francisella sp. FSC1006]AIT09480.1 ATP synthase F0F1 subunit delta [Francisella sp. FSC1006]
MASLNVIAKPYAKAAFEFASENKALTAWSSQLKALSQLVESDVFVSVVSNPVISQLDIVKAIAENVDENFANFLTLIAENKRLQIMAVIAQQFEAIADEHKSKKSAEVTLAYKADKELLDSLKSSLEKRFGCSISMKVSVDKDIIGGAIIKVGDTVIDDSVSGRLEKLKSILLS